MTNVETRSGGVAAITGFAPGLSRVLAHRLLAQGYTVAGLSRSGKTLEDPSDGFRAFACDVTDSKAVADTFAAIRGEMGDPTLLIHNAARLVIRDFLDIDPGEFEQSWRVACFGGMLCARAVLPGMLEAGRGTLVFTGATASIKGGARFSAFASSKFALRGLAQSLARQYGPRGVHVVHTVIDGVIWGERAEHTFAMERGACMEPEHIADTYMQLIGQQPTSWTHEVDLRPANESF